ncbi:MAG: DJ-1/PfpI family protein, partial [Helicobacteraceae bacterium]|nr:DJ-1/PfpI family protein [Helicobacteraceae bacterium]
MADVKVLVPLAKGFEEIEAVGIIDVLRRGGIEVFVASLDDKALVKGANGITIQTDMQISDVP